MLDYIGNLLKYYPQFSLEYIMYDLSMDLGFALISFSLGRDGWMNLCGVKPISKTYLEQEVDKLITQYCEVYNKK